MHPEDLLVIADVHLGLPLVGEAGGVVKTSPGVTWATDTLTAAHRAGLRHLIVLGDLVDKSAGPEDLADGRRVLAGAVSLFDTVLFIAGNHDAHHDMSDLVPAGVLVAGTQPHSVELGGWNLHTAAVAEDGDTRRLIPDFPPAVPGRHNVGLYHSSVTGEFSLRPCLPCTPGDLLGRGYGAWILGHAHTPQVLSRLPFLGWVGQGRALQVSAAGDAAVSVRKF